MAILKANRVCGPAPLQSPVVSFQGSGQNPGDRIGKPTELFYVMFVGLFSFGMAHV